MNLPPKCYKKIVKNWCETVSQILTNFFPILILLLEDLKLYLNEFDKVYF